MKKLSLVKILREDDIVSNDEMEPHHQEREPINGVGYRRVFNFPNGYGLSAIGPQHNGTWEVGILKGDDLDTTNILKLKLFKYDEVATLPVKAVNQLIAKIKSLPPPPEMGQPRQSFKNPRMKLEN